MGEANPLTFLYTVEPVKYATPSCCPDKERQSSQTAAEHMFRHALICLIIPLADGIDRDKLIAMALVHDITDFRSWDGLQKKKCLNMDYLACNLPQATAKGLQDYWAEYWGRETPEAKLAHEICAFEHVVASDEDGYPCGNSIQDVISSPELLMWATFLDSSKREMNSLQNGASFGSSYWDDPVKNMRLLDEVISKGNLATSPLPFIRMLRYMSAMKRKGWMNRGMDPTIVDVESDASHSWQVSLICLLFSPKEEASKSFKLGLVHDLGEIVIGDVAPADGVAKADKQRHEHFGQKFLVHVSQTNAMEPFFTEFEAHEAVAARITHEADDLECRVQAVAYIRRYPQFETLIQFLEFPVEAVYFEKLTHLLSLEEVSLREKRSRLKIIFVIGGPGVGKDTLCVKLAKEHSFRHIPTGDLLRKEVDHGSRFSRFISDSMLIGFTVPAELMINLLVKEAKGSTTWLLNGFPRSLNQLSTFQEHLCRSYSTLFLSCPDSVLTCRLKTRALTSGRPDDEESAISKRLASFRNEEQLRLLECLKQSGPFEEVNGSGSKDEVFALANTAIMQMIEPPKV